MGFELQVRQAIYGHFADSGRAPTPAEVAARAGGDVEGVLAAYRRLAAERLLVLEPDRASIRMAPPFSGVETQHVVESGGVRYFANCAWDALGIPAALGRPATVRSECAQSGEALDLAVGPGGAESTDWLFHTLVPAAKWWEDIVFT